MNVAFLDRFYSELPIDILVFGRACKIISTGGYGVEVFVGEEVNTQVVAKAMDLFEGRKAVSMIRDTAPKEYEVPRILRNDIADFLRFFLNQPIGSRVLTFERLRGFYLYDHRKTAIDQAFLTWHELEKSARSVHGQLNWPIPCCGYLSANRGLCRNSLFDLSGCCPIHGNPTSKTLFNFYAWFNREGFPEFSDRVQLEDRPSLSQRAVNKANKNQLMDVLLNGKQGQTLSREEISNIIGMEVAPSEPGYPIIHSAIHKCRKAFVFWHWFKDRSLYECTYADADASQLLELCERPNFECTPLYDLMFKRYLAWHAKWLANHELEFVDLHRKFADQRREILDRDWPLEVDWSAVPESLRTTEFLDAWSSWLIYYKRSKLKLTLQVFRDSLAKLENWGPARSAAVIEHSIENCWRGIFEPQ